MTPSSEYCQCIEGAWSLWILHEKWQTELWQIVLPLIEKRPFSKHPQTLQVKARFGAGGDVLFLKIFHGSSGMSALKDIFRDSKALRSMRQAAALERFNFNVPITVAAGEKREHGLLRKAFVLTLQVKGQSLPDFLRQHGLGVESVSLLEKRNGLKQLALEVRRLHQLGFVHGDLVPTNIFVSRTAEKGNRFFFMDNDRTRRYPKWFPQVFWRRNLVQLNRIPLPGITLQDRVRFLSHYLGLKEWGNKGRRLLSWLERKTRQRRKECDSVDANGSFRQLMRWHGELT
ncbi:MAG TPA: lipopolysaccharide kinase InaA family protein [Candidatus Binatia bacterium]|nr:lipopolysaccharide kinase InaA family protein [Candidatus Binatia bacterium]